MIKEFVAPRPKLYSYLTNKKIKSEDFKKRLENNRILLRLEQKFRSELHKVFPEGVNKISLNENDDKRLQTLD